MSILDKSPRQLVNSFLRPLGYVPRTEIKKAFRYGSSLALRSYAAAQQNRLTGDFPGFSTTFDSDIRSALSVVRARSRELCKNNPHGKRFTRLLRMNVPGPKGFKFQSNVTELDVTNHDNPKKVQDKVANIIIEEAFAKWCKPQFCSVTGNQSFKDIQHLAITHAGRDGEILIREVWNKSAFGYQLQILEPDMLDEQYSGRAKNGNVIRMGVEMDVWRRPVAYYLKQFDPALDVYGQIPASGSYERVPADEIIHVFDQESAFQSRGMPWTTASLMKLHMLGEYEFAAVTKARVGATNLGFIIPSKDNPEKASDEGVEDEENEQTVINTDPLSINQLPAGADFKDWDSDYPSAQYEMFTKAILRSIASGLDVSYMSLTTDLNDTTYGSGRIGIIDEREGYKERQEWFIQNVLNRIFANWLKMALLKNQLRLPIEKYDKFNQPSFVGRRWSWLDPLKDAQAAEMLLKLRLTTRTQIVAEQGDDFLDLLQDTVAEMEMAKELGIDLTITPTPIAPADPNAEPPAQQAKSIREIVEEILQRRNGHSHAHHS